MPTQRNDFLLGLQIGQQIVGPLAGAMGQWRDDRIANELMQTVNAPRAQAVGPNAGAVQAAADKRAASMPIPLGNAGGTRGLALRLQLDKAMRERNYDSARTDYWRAKADNAAKPGGAGGSSSKPESYWLSLAEKHQREPEMVAYREKLQGWRASLAQHQKDVGKMQAEIAKIESGLAGKLQGSTGRSDLSILAAPTERAKEGGILGFGASEVVKIKTPDGEVKLSPDEYSELASRFAELQTRRKAAAAMKEPAMPVFTPAQRSSGGDQAAEALAWAKAHPDDPRAAKILQLLGAGATE